MKNKEREIYKEKGERLLEAVEAGSFSRVKTLINLGADVNYADDKRWTPLHEAVVWGHFDIVKLLLKYGADINAKDDQGYTILHSAINPQGKARKDGNFKLICYLIMHDANRAKNNYGYDELFLAAEVNPNPRVVNLFYKYNSFDRDWQINKKYKWDYTVLMAAVRYNKSLEVIQYLIDKGADVNAVDWEGASVFMHAAANDCNDDVSRLKLLLKYGCKTDAVTQCGENAYDFACHQGNDNVQEFLESMGIHHEIIETK